LPSCFKRRATLLQASLDAARQRLHEIVILRMKTWIREETRRGLRDAEDWRRGEVRLHFQVLERFREEQRRRHEEQPHLGKVK
jgi:Tfp pilus assembly protein PilN